jgi:hypothetical protein
MRPASTTWSTVTSDSPMWPTLPSSRRSLSVLERTDLVGERHERVDPVQLEQFDALQPQPAQAQLSSACVDLAVVSPSFGGFGDGLPQDTTARSTRLGAPA